MREHQRVPDRDMGSGRCLRSDLHAVTMGRLTATVLIIIGWGFIGIALWMGWVENSQPVVSRLELPQRHEPTSVAHLWGQDFSDDDQVCMAVAIYFEARSEPIEGQYAVADVIMNRFMHADYPNTICGVVQDGRYRGPHPIRNQCQFSYWCDGRSDMPTDATAFTSAMAIARDVLTNPEYPGIIEYALFYHADYVTPNWAERMMLVGKVGTHLFYSVEGGP